jgi:phenylalanyl-tRNA synthetase beta chain
VVREVDLIEEVARLRGYDSFSSELRPFRPGRVPDAPGWAVARRVTDALVAAGLFEVRPMPFVAAGGDGAEPHVRVTNPLAEDEPYLRRDILETLAARAEYNLRQMQGNVRLFEVGTVFQPNSDRRPGSLPREEMRVGALLMGARRPPHFAGDAEPPSIDEWDAKGVAELAVAAVYPGECALRPPSGQDAGGRLWDIVKTADGGAAEIVGGVRRLALDAPVWAKPAFGIELRLWAVDSAPVAPPGSGVQLQTEVKRVGLADQTVRYRPIPTLPAAEIDLALIVPDRDRAGETLTAEIVEGVVRRASGELLERIVLFDEFRDEAKWPNARSLAWRLTFRHPERTLRDKEIDGRRDKVLKTLESELGVKPRI